MRKVFSVLLLITLLNLCLPVLNMGYADTKINTTLVQSFSPDSDIIALRKRLCELGFFSSSLPDDPEYRLYTNKLIASIRAFQQYIHDNLDDTMIVDGIAGPQTIAWLNRNDAPVNPKNQKEVPKATEIPNKDYKDSYSETITKEASTGERRGIITKESSVTAIAKLRRKLIDLGWFDAESHYEGTLYTSGLINSIVDFQQYVHDNLDPYVIVDGIVDRKTYDWIYRDDAPSKLSAYGTPKPTNIPVTRVPMPEPTPVSTLLPEDYDQQVADIQALLIDAGWLESGSVTGIYDENTIEAVKDLQKHLHNEYGFDLDYDGYYGPRERELLESNDERAIAPEHGKGDEQITSNGFLGFDDLLTSFATEKPTQPQQTADIKRENTDFKSFSWGDSSSVIKAVEGDIILSQYDNTLQMDTIYYLANPCGISCVLGYGFKEDKLQYCAYVSTTTHTQSSAYVTDY